MILNKFSFVSWVVILIISDQISKLFLLRYFPEIIHYNYGVAFSFAVSILIPILVGIVITGLIVYLIAKKKLPADFYWAIFIGGTIGNLIDRIRIGKVIDFISIGNFPVFNLADTYITISAIFIFYSLIKKND